MIRKLLLSLVVLTCGAFGQAVRYDSIAQVLTANNLYTPVSNGTVLVYNYPGATTNCATSGTCTLATTYIDDIGVTSCGTSVPLTRPTFNSCIGSTDAGANFGFWIKPGSYQYCISGTGVGTSCTNITVGQTTSIIVANCSDVGLNAAITALPSTGGTVDARGCIGTVTLAAVVRINKPGTTLILSGAATYTNTTGVPISQGMFSPEADNVTILGNNANLVLVGAQRYGVRPLNSCSNVLVRDLVITGDATIGEQQEGIAFANSSQGWTFKHIQLIHNTISNTNIGIDLVNTDTVSTTEDVLVQGNKIFNIVGVLAGSGYGLIANNTNSATNILRPMALKIIGNHFENSGRHEVYTSMTSGVTVTGNTFLRHRASVFTNGDFAAVPIARVTNYVLADNVFDTCYDGCVDVQTDSAQPPASLIARNISITGNVFRNSQWYDIIIGTGANPATDGFPDGVTIAGNAFYKESSQVPTLAFFIFIQSGKNININSNSFYMKGVAGDLIDIEGSFDSGGTALATDRIFVQGNLLFADTAGATPFRFNSAASTSAIRADFINNYVSIPSGNVFGFISGQTDTNIHVFNTLTSGLDLTKVAPLDGFTGQLRQTIGSGTATTNGTAIASLTSQAQPAITITGATTGDVADCSLNVAPPATWQTGIQQILPVVTANTVTLWLSNPTAGSITPAATAFRCTVSR